MDVLRQAYIYLFNHFTEIKMSSSVRETTISDSESVLVDLIYESPGLQSGSCRVLTETPEG